MLSPYCSTGFQSLFDGQPLEVLNTGVFRSPTSDNFPYKIVRKVNLALSQPANFLVTLPCFSGPSQMEFPEIALAIRDCFQNWDIAGGFLQSRLVVPDSPKLVRNESFIGLFDTRTNYRISLSQSSAEWLTCMRRDSRSRVRKLLQNRHAYELRVCDKEDLHLINAFAQLYQSVSSRIGFSATYHFELNKFCSLLSDENWNLYLLYMHDEIIAGAVVATLPEGGYDYTFMGHNSEYPDASRAMIYFLVEHLIDIRGQYLDLGGGISEDDHLARFKRSMGGEETLFLRCKFAFLNHPSLKPESIIGPDFLAGYWP